MVKPSFLHHHPGAEAQDREREQLFQGIGKGLVSVADLFGLEACFEVRRQVVTKAGVQLRLHL